MSVVKFERVSRLPLQLTSPWSWAATAWNKPTHLPVGALGGVEGSRGVGLSVVCAEALIHWDAALAADIVKDSS